MHHPSGSVFQTGATDAFLFEPDPDSEQEQRYNASNVVPVGTRFRTSTPAGVYIDPSLLQLQTTNTRNNQTATELGNPSSVV